MKRMLSLSAVSLFIGMTAMTFGSQDCAGSEDVRERFVGAWRLAWLEEEGADGKTPRRTAPSFWSTRATATCRSR
jgi:hypothetical protein